MPNIRELDAGPLGLRPSETGVEATAQAARRIGTFSHQTAEEQIRLGQMAGGAIRDAGDAAVAYEDHREITNGATTGAKLFSDLDQKWNDTVKTAMAPDGTVNESIKGQFQDEVLGPALDKFNATFNTQKSQAWGEHFVDQTRTHFFNKTSADMSRLAGDSVAVQAATIKNTWANTVYNDPSSLDTGLDMVDHKFDGIVSSSHSLTGDQVGTVRNQLTLKTKADIVDAAIKGAIDKGGDWHSIADNPKYQQYVNKGEVTSYERRDRAQRKTDLIAQRTLENYQHQQEDRAATADRSKAFSSNVQFEPGTMRPIINPKYIQDTMDTVRNYPGAGPDHARTAIGWAEAQADRKEVVSRSDPATIASLDTKLFDPSISPVQMEMALMKAHGIDKKLTDADFHNRLEMAKLAQEAGMKGAIWQDTMSAAKGQLGTDPKGEEAYGKFVSTFLPKYAEQFRAGTLPANALNMNDPQSLIRQSLDQFKREPMQMYLDRLTHGIIAPGESSINPNSLADALRPGGSKTNPASMPPIPKTLEGQPVNWTEMKNKKTGSREFMFFNPNTNTAYDKDGNPK